MKIIFVSDQPKEKYGIYGNCISVKGESDILKKSQQSIKDRFGYSYFEDDPENEFESEY